MIPGPSFDLKTWEEQLGGSTASDFPMEFPTVQVWALPKPNVGKHIKTTRNDCQTILKGAVYGRKPLTLILTLCISDARHRGMQ